LKAFRLIRVVWVVVAVTTAVLAETLGERGVIPAVVLGLMSAPAGALANFFPPSSIDIEGLPAFSLYPVLTAAFGFAQWFWLAPRIVSSVMSWHRIQSSTRFDVIRKKAADVVILLTTWLLAEAVAIAFSMTLNRVTDRFPCHVWPVLFHLWLAIPMAATATFGATAIVYLFRDEGSAFWIGALALLFLCTSTLLNTPVLLSFDAGRDPIGPLVEAVTPALVCVLAGMVVPRRLFGGAA
jgi:hypothetical protein